jgi:hypothetical protein
MEEVFLKVANLGTDSLLNPTHRKLSIKESLNQDK